MKISIIIPTYNEEEHIERIIAYLKKYAVSQHLEEIIVVDGWSSDNTLFLAQKAGARIFKMDNKSRPGQMNKGAQMAKGDVVYFLHADTLPPKNFSTDIFHALEKGFVGGTFRLRFDRDHWLLNAFCWFTRFNINMFRFGDQSLFVKKEIFDFARGFNTKLRIMEDQEIIGRIKKFGQFTVLKNPVTTSARKFEINGNVRLFMIFLRIFFMYKMGVSQDSLVSYYRKHIKEGKI